MKAVTVTVATLMPAVGVVVGVASATGSLLAGLGAGAVMAYPALPELGRARRETSR